MFGFGATLIHTVRILGDTPLNTVELDNDPAQNGSARVSDFEGQVIFRYVTGWSTHPQLLQA